MKIGIIKAAPLPGLVKHRGQKDQKDAVEVEVAAYS